MADKRRTTCTVLYEGIVFLDNSNDDEVAMGKMKGSTMGVKEDEGEVAVSGNGNGNGSKDSSSQARLGLSVRNGLSKRGFIGQSPSGPWARDWEAK